MSLGVSVQGVSVPGVSVQEGICPGGKCPGGICPWVSVQGYMSGGFRPVTGKVL